MRSAAKPQVRYCASNVFVPTNTQNGLPAWPPEVRFYSLGPYPKPREQPIPGLAARSVLERYDLSIAVYCHHIIYSAFQFVANM